MKWGKYWVASILGIVPLGAQGASPAAGISSGDTAWVLFSSGLVLFMTIPALALFYGGLVRRKNVLSVLMQCFITLAAVSVLWVTVGYTLAFSPKPLIPGILGNFDYAFLRGVGQAPSTAYATTVPHIAFMLFQMMFAAITPALIIGAFAERMRFSGFLVFTLLWTLLVYCPVAHWMWSPDGWLYKAGALDFAGGVVVHINAGVAALAAAYIIGRRRSIKAYPPHNLTYTMMGAAMLWFGWFGFNGGSALAANGLAAHAVLVTHLAASAATLLWMILDWMILKRPTILGAATGAIAGLAAITPGAGYVDVMGAMAIGLVSSGLCYAMVMVVKPRFMYDDALDAFGVHGIGGIWGTLAVGIFASPAVQPAVKGLFSGSGSLFFSQLLATITVGLFAFIATAALLKAIDVLVSLRVSNLGEAAGLDVTEHHERAYTIIE